MAASSAKSPSRRARNCTINARRSAPKRPKPSIFSMLHDREIQFRAEAQSHAHDVVVENGLAVVGDGDRSRPLQGAEVGESSALAAPGGGGDGEDVDQGCALGIAEPCDPFRGVNYGRGVGHGADRGEASGSRGGGTGSDGLFVTLAGLAQVNVQVDETGGDDQATGVEFFIGTT